jgi:hypothetical protein
MPMLGLRAAPSIIRAAGRFGSGLQREKARIMDGRIWRVLAALLMMLWAGSAGAQTAAAIGSVTALIGQAQVTHEGAAAARPLAPGANVFENDRIRTAADAKLRLDMADGSVLTLGAATELNLSRFHYAPEAAARNVLLEVPRGIIRVLVNLLVANSTFDLQTHTAVASVRGTDWIAEAQPDATAIVGLAGRVAVRSDEAAIGGAVVLLPGDGTTVRAEQPPSAPTQWGAARKNSFIERTALP